MKNNYAIVVSCCFLMLSGMAFSQDAYITGIIPVKNQKGTLLYFGEKLELTSAVNTDRTFINSGKIKINGSFVNNGDGKNFVSTWTDAENYGQVIIAQDAEVGENSFLSLEKNKINPSSSAWGQFAIPFDKFSTTGNGNTYGDLQPRLFGTNYSNGGNRYYASMMVWDNTGKPEFDHKRNTDEHNPTNYVILNLTYYSAGLRGIMETNPDENLTYSGRPAKAEYTAQYKPSIYYQGKNWGVWAYYTNSYNEKYYSYLGDAVRDYETDSIHYAKYFFEFGNPYTSNIDLSDIGLNNGGAYVENLMSVSRITGTNWNINDGGSSQAATVQALWNGSIWSGNPDALIVPPFETFIIGLNEGADDDAATHDFVFDDSLKTFDYSSLAEDENFFTDDGGKMNPLNYYFNTFSRDHFFQLRLKLYDEYDHYTGNEAYVVVKRNGENGVNDKLESEYSDFGDRSGFFLAQENADGSEVETSNRKMYINTVSFTYASKPIQLFFNRKNGDYNGYYVKADLFYQSIFNKLKPPATNFHGPNSFYFYDKFEDVLLPITTDFNYYIEYSDNPLEDRYQVFWNGGPMGDERLAVQDEENYQTIIYKDQDTYKIRFNTNWDTAQIKLYDLSGKILQTYENVKTDVDFEFELPGAGVYVVKLVSEKGEIHTQKIINH